MPKNNTKPNIKLSKLSDIGKEWCKGYIDGWNEGVEQAITVINNQIDYLKRENESEFAEVIIGLEESLKILEKVMARDYEDD